MEYGCIYMIRCSVSRKVYIGQTIDYEKRTIQHLNFLKNNKHHNVYLQHTFNKYGVSSLKFFILQDYILKDNLNKLEKSWILKFNSRINGFNNTDGGEDNKGINNPRAKINENIVKNIIDDYLTGNYIALELSLKYNTSESNIRNILNDRSWINMTPETKDKIKIIAKNNLINGNKKYKRKTKEIIWDNKKFNSQSELSDFLGINSSVICYYKKNNINKSSDISLVNKSKKIIVENSICFYSISDTAKYYKKERGTVRYWVKRGKAQFI